jgi:hypothetical protein
MDGAVSRPDLVMIIVASSLKAKSPTGEGVVL